MRPRHYNNRRVLLQAITVLALCAVAACAFFMSTATQGSRVHLGRGTVQPPPIEQSQPLAVGVDPQTGDTTVVSQDQKGGVQRVIIPGAAIQQNKTSPLSEEPKSAAPQGKSAGD